jgi:nucleoside phosphorylase
MELEIIQELIVRIEKAQLIMVAVAAGTNIRQQENSYKKLYQEIDISLEIIREEGLEIYNPNKFNSLWDWDAYYSSKNLNPNSTVNYIYDLYLPTINILENYKYENISDYPLKCIDNLEISLFENIFKKIEQIKKIMISVARGESKAEDREEFYTKIYKDITLQIINLDKIGLSISNPNYFRSLYHWKAYSLLEMTTYKLREDYVNGIYANIVDSIKKSIDKHRLKGSSQKEFVEDLKVSLKKSQSIKALTPISLDSNKDHKSANISIPTLLNEENATEIQSFLQIESIYNQKSPEPFIAPIDVNNNQGLQPSSSNKMTDVVIITALQKEQDAVLRYLNYHQTIENFGQTFYRAFIQTNRPDTTYQVVIVCLRQMGNVQAALVTQRAIAEFNPSHIILTGIAGGVPKENSHYLGDIIVGEQVVYYELAKLVQVESGKSEVKSKYQVYRPAKILLDAAKNLQKSLDWISCIKAQRADGTTGRVNPIVHFGVVASGDKVITDPVFRDKLLSDWSQLVGFEMEGGGAAIAAYESNFLQGILAIKGMCDWGDVSKNDAWQEYAAESAACFVVELLKSAPFESKLKANISNSQEVSVESKLTIEALTSEEKLPVIPISDKRYSGQVKLIICQRLVRDWENLADYFDIPLHERDSFEPAGKKAHRVWEWLELRNRLHELEAALGTIGRGDLVNELNK